MKSNLQSAVVVLIVLCTVQLALVFYLIQISNNREQTGINDLLKAVPSHVHLMQKRLVPQSRKRIRTSSLPYLSTSGTTSIRNISTNKSNDEWQSSGAGCNVIHVAIVCAGSTSVRTVQPLLKSLLFFRRRNPIHLHLVVDEVSYLIFNRLLSSWAIPSLNFSFYQTHILKPIVDWIPNLHYSGVYGLMKLALVEVLPSQLDKVIVLDTDITCNSDIAELWDFFRKFTSKQVIGLIDNQSNWYLRPNHWPALGRGFNTGVVLMDLEGLREIRWTQLWRNVTIKTLKWRNKTHLADQDIINAVLKLHPERVHVLPCEWNVQLNENALSEWCYLREDLFLKMIHWNSPLKDRVHNKDSETFRKTYLAFAEYDGGLLKRQIFGCQQKTLPKPRQQLTTSKPNAYHDSCTNMRKAGSAIYRTHLYYFNFDDFHKGNSCDVTLVTQLSMDRILMLETIANQWQGPISAAIYATDAEALSLIDFISASTVLGRRRNIGYHIVYKQTYGQALYPVNYLRNVAMGQVETDFQMLSDVDFVPKLKLREYLIEVLYSNSNITLETKVAFVLPAFETTLHRFFLPIYKKLLLALWDRNLVTPFRFGMWKAGQFSVNYTRWRNAVEPYEVSWSPYFEPFVVVSRFAPEFDTRFVGFGWNKVAYTITLHSQGYRFVVLPEAFIVHLPHSPSLSNNRFRLDYRYRSCMHQLKREFLRDIHQKYKNPEIKMIV